MIGERTMQLDHLVIAAATLADSAAWCERIFGITPVVGGKHAFMGTHNSLISIVAPRFPKAYAEIIAIDPDGTAPARPRWFDLDDAALQRALRDGPRLIHWVARTSDIHAAGAALRACGIEPGVPEPAERHTPRGVLRWQIGLRADGKRLFGGALPTLIQWGDVHPADALPASGVQLEAVQLAGLPDAVIAALGDVPGVQGVANDTSEPIRATLSGPRGQVMLTSWQAAG